MAKINMVLHTLVDLFRFMESGRLAVPSFQRGYVWSKERVRELFVSVDAGYPIGTLVAVDQTADHFEVASPELSKFPTPREHKIQDLHRLWLIDGTQRLAALYNGLSNDLQPFELYYDLYDHEFLFSGKTKKKAKKALLRMSTLFKAGELMSLQVRLAQSPNAEPLLSELNNIRERFYSYSVPMMIMKDVKDSEIVEIFARMNTSGRGLTKAELAQAMKFKKSH